MQHLEVVNVMLLYGMQSKGISLFACWEWSMFQALLVKLMYAICITVCHMHHCMPIYGMPYYTKTKRKIVYM